MTDPDFRDPDLDRAYRETPRDEPSPEVDERIRAAARRAVGTRPQSLEQRAVEERRRSWAFRWRLPLSVAATVVIAATLTVMVQEEERRPRDDAGRGAVQKMDVAPTREAEPPAAPAVGSPDAARERLRESQTIPAPPAQPSTPARLKSSSEPAAARSESPPQPKLEERARELQRPAAADSAPAAPVEPEMRRQAPAPAAAPPVAAPAPTAPPPAVSPPAAGAVTAPAPRSADKTTQETAPPGAASNSLRRDRTFGDRPERASREASPSVVRSPEAWVEYIRSLRAQGREAEATAELADLRRTYPDFQLPPDLVR